MTDPTPDPTAQVLFPPNRPAELVGSGVDPRVIVLAAEGGASVREILARWPRLTEAQVRLVLRLREAILTHGASVAVSRRV